MEMIEREFKIIESVLCFRDFFGSFGMADRDVRDGVKK
jgi:hypothetical protein